MVVMTLPKYICVGRATRPHGLGGYVEVLSLTDNPDRFEIGRSFRLNPPLPGCESVEISKIKQKKDRHLIQFKNFDSRDQAESLCGRELLIAEEEAVKPSDSFWVHEVVGCTVVTTAGETLGKVSEVMRTGGNDVYVVNGEKTYYIPAVKQFVKKIDPGNGLIEIEPLPGLLEL
jgi:16S rRNA processing protein RimM